MEINITLFGEMLTFAVLVWAVVKYIWPPIIAMIDERQAKIVEGLEAAERGHHQLELAHEKAAKELKKARGEGASILEEASQKANAYVEEGRTNAQVERVKILDQAKINIEQETNKAKHELEKQVANLVVSATEKLLESKVDDVADKKLIDKLISSI